MSDRRPYTKKRLDLFLEKLAEGCSVTKACQHVAIDRRNLYRLRETDQEFAEQWAAAYERGTDTLRDEVVRRGRDGVEDFKLDKNGNEHPVRVYSDNLLMFELKRRDPSYRDNHRIEIGGLPGGEPVHVEVNGGRVTGLGGVLQLARELGVGLALGVREGLGAGAALDALPAAAEVRAGERSSEG